MGTNAKGLYARIDAAYQRNLRAWDEIHALRDRAEKAEAELGLAKDFIQRMRAVEKKRLRIRATPRSMRYLHDAAMAVAKEARIRRVNSGD